MKVGLSPSILTLFAIPPLGPYATIFIRKITILILKIVRLSCKNCKILYKFSGKFGIARSYGGFLFSGGYACGRKNLRRRFSAQTSGETSGSEAPFNITVTQYRRANRFLVFWNFIQQYFRKKLYIQRKLQKTVLWAHLTIF